MALASAVVVPTGPMCMAMAGFFLGRIAHRYDFHVKGKRLPRQRVVGIDINVELADFHHGYLYGPLLGLQAQDLANNR